MDIAYQFATGEITGNPTSALPAGTRIDFIRQRFPAPDALGIRAIHDWQRFNGAVLSLLIWGGDTFSLEGSAVMAAPGVALTAKHVAHQWLPQLQKGEMKMRLVGFASGALQFWDVQQVSSDPDTDVTLLAVSPASKLPDGNRYTTSMFTTRMVRVGERVVIVGFRANQDFFNINCDEQNIGFYCPVSVGTVSAVFPDGREGLFKAPSFDVDCHPNLFGWRAILEAHGQSHIRGGSPIENLSAQPYCSFCCTHRDARFRGFRA